MSTKKIQAFNEFDRKERPSVINGIKLSDEPDAGKIISVRANIGKTGELIQLSYSNTKIVGNGSFGVVFQAKLSPSGEFAAVKKVLQDKRFKNRELQIMRAVNHPNIVGLKFYFYSNGVEKEEVILNLVLEYLPETVYRASRHYTKLKQSMPMLYIKVDRVNKAYMYQLFRSMGYIHALGICHRDIKPQNLLLDHNAGILKLCDFGSAKVLIENEPNVSYICSRFYRAPELIFGSTSYNNNIWSCGCVMAELILGNPLFPGESAVDQLVQIIKVLGTPTREQIHSMNENYTDYKFPQIKAAPWSKVLKINKIFKSRNPTPESIDILSTLLDYTPNRRPTAFEAMTHPFFDELRLPETRLPNGRELPQLFNFSALELSIQPNLNMKLIPDYAKSNLSRQGIDLALFKPIEILKLTTLSDS